VVVAYAKDRKYDGISIIPKALDQETRLQHFKFHVATAIRLCQGPRLYKANIEMVESQCAILMCEGSAHQVVIDFAQEHGRIPLKSDLFALLDEQAGVYFCVE
jgi:lactam utilization protein B